jgi:hypothetical protein
MKFLWQDKKKVTFPSLRYMRVDNICNILFQIIDCSSKESFMNPVFYSDERTDCTWTVQWAVESDSKELSSEKSYS